MRMKHIAIKEIICFHWLCFMTRTDFNQFTLWSLWLIFYPERILNDGYQLLWVWTSQLQDRVWNRCALLVSNHYTICSPVQCHERRAKPQQCGSECQSCVNTAAVRPSAANLAPLSLQQYHPKYSTHTITSVSILTTGRIVTSALLLLPVCDYSRLISHFTALRDHLWYKCYFQHR